MTDKVKLAFEEYMANGGAAHMAKAMTKGLPSGYRDLMEIAFTRGAIAGMSMGAEHVARTQELITEALLGPKRAAL